jgi:hypothetical protein
LQSGSTGSVVSILSQAKQEDIEAETPPTVGDAGDINLANALDLSESEEEEEMEDIIDDFSQNREVSRCAGCFLDDPTSDICSRIIKVCDKSVSIYFNFLRLSRLSSPSHQRNPIPAKNPTSLRARVNVSHFQKIRSLQRLPLLKT